MAIWHQIIMLSAFKVTNRDRHRKVTCNILFLTHEQFANLSMTQAIAIQSKFLEVLLHKKLLKQTEP